MKSGRFFCGHQRLKFATETTWPPGRSLHSRVPYPCALRWTCPFQPWPETRGLTWWLQDRTARCWAPSGWISWLHTGPCIGFAQGRIQELSSAMFWRQKKPVWRQCEVSGVHSLKRQRRRRGATRKQWRGLGAQGWLFRIKAINSDFNQLSTILPSHFPCWLSQGWLNGTHFGGIKLDAKLYLKILREFPS